MWKGLFYVEVRGVKLDLIPHVGELLLPNVPVKEWNIDPYVHSLLDGPNTGMWLPTHNGEIIQLGMMTWGACMDINGGRCPETIL